MRWLTLTASVAGLLLATIACDTDKSSTPTPTVDITPPKTQVASPVTTPTIKPCTNCRSATPSGFGPLTNKEGTLAKQIVEQDPTLASLLGDRAYVLGYGRWELQGELVGASMSISFEEPIFVDADLPSIDTGYRDGTYIELPPPHYVEMSSHYVMQTQAFGVIVDFDRATVIAIHPIPLGIGVS